MNPPIHARQVARSTTERSWLGRTTHVAYLLLIFFFNDTATTEIYTLSLHDALPISTVSTGAAARIPNVRAMSGRRITPAPKPATPATTEPIDRKSTRLNSSHLVISYAVFCLKKKKR